MRKTPKTIPVFASEEEELRFWDEHNPADYFTEPVDVIVDLKKQRKRMVSVRIDESLHDELKAVAASHGLPYQRLMRELLRQALRNLAISEGRPPRPQGVTR
jgi:predicted DNA binding CopG/RHH family protein